MGNARPRCYVKRAIENIHAFYPILYRQNEVQMPEKKPALFQMSQHFAQEMIPLTSILSHKGRGSKVEQ